MTLRWFVAVMVAMALAAAIPAPAQEGPEDRPPSYEELHPPAPTAPLYLDDEAHAKLVELERQAEAMPRDQDLQARLGMLYIRIGRVEEGLAALTRAMELAPGNPKYRYEYARGLFAAEYYKESMEAIEGLVDHPRVTPGLAADVLVLSGSTRMRLRDMRGAEADFLDAIDHDPNHVPALLNLGVLKMAVGKRGQGLHFTRQASFHAPDNAKVQSTYAQMLESIDRVEDAFEVWTRVAELVPDDGNVQMKLAYYHLGDRDDEAARPYLERAIAANPLDGIAHLQLAELHTRGGDLDAAWENLVRAEELGVPAEALRSRLETWRRDGVDPMSSPEAYDESRRRLEESGP